MPEHYQKPSIGRIVHYVMGENDSGPAGQTAAAIITRVWSDTCVNLTVIADDGLFCVASSREFGDGPHNWTWPPRI